MLYRSLLALLTLGLFTTCATDDIARPVDPDTVSTAFFEPRETTLILDEDTNQDILSFDPENGMLIYKTGSPQLDSIEVGSIILSRPNAEAEGGFLRKVMAIDVSGDRVVVETEPANLPDAFERYRWRLDGDGSARGRDDEESPFFTFGQEPIAWDTLFDIPGQDDWKFKLAVEFNYTLEFASAVDFNVGFTGGQIESMNMGINRFSVEGLVLTMSFINAQSSDTTLSRSFTLPEVAPSFDNLLEIGLARFPVDPPTSLVWVQPVITIDLSTIMEYSVEMGNRFTFQTDDGHFYGLAQIASPGGPVTFTNGAPGGMCVNGEVFFDGTYKYGNGLSVGIGIAPYTRDLFTIGARATVGPSMTLTGNASAGLTCGEADVELSAQATVDIDASAGLFLDADFFGLAPDDWDIEQTIWENSFNVWSLGIDNSCGFFFSELFANVTCDGEDRSLAFAVTTQDATNLDVSGTYDLYVDNIYLGGNYPPGTTHTVMLPTGIEPGPHSIRFVREGGQSILFCEDAEIVNIPECRLNPYCDGLYFITDALSNRNYCVRDPAGTGQEWMTENLATLVPEGNSFVDPRCYDGDTDFCTVFGGLYDWNQLLDHYDEVSSPPNLQGLCPQGFHVPTVDEWLTLFAAEGTLETAEGFTIPGVGFPYRATTTWGDGFEPDTPNGFDALAGGWFTESSNAGYTGRGEHAYFWTSTVTETTAEGGESGAYAVIMEKTTNDVKIKPVAKSLGLSCRCVAD